MYDRIAKLVERLHEKTKARAIAWGETPNESFQASFAHYTVELSREGADVFLGIYNEEGRILESVSDEMIKTQPGLARQGIMLYDLYAMARRTALGSDEAIEDLISSLED
jgi:hypothetical protein